MPILFRGNRTNFNERTTIKLAFEVLDNSKDKLAAREMLDIPEDEMLYIQILREDEIPDSDKL